jgi:ABC-type branched-subunit amino acid transport system substrate-binding protein
MPSTRSRPGLRRLAIIALVSAIITSVSACGGGSAESSNSNDRDTFDILMLASTSGGGAKVGAAFVAAAKAGVDLVNATGGANGQQMTLKVIDDAGDPQVGVTAMQTELASGKEYDLIIPGTTGVIASAVVPTIAQNPALQMSSAFIDDPQKAPRYFSTGGPKAQTQAVADYASAKSYRHLGILAVDNATSRAVVGLHESAAKRAGARVDAAFVPAGSVDATPQWQQLISSGVNAVILAGFDPQTASLSIIKGKVKLGIDLPIIADQTFASNQLKGAGVTNADLAGIDMQALAYLVKGTPASESKLMKSYLAALDHQSGGAMLPLGITSIMTLTIAIAADGATAARSSTGDAIAKKLENISKEELPRSLGPGHPFSKETHAQQWTAGDYVFVPMSVDTDEHGFIIPGKG